MEVIQKTLHEQKNLHKKLEDLRRADLGQIHLGFTGTQSTYVLPYFLPQFKEKYPNINQAEYAIKLFVINSDLSGFTNDNNSRSYLGLVSLPTKIIDALTKDLPDSYKNALYSIINLNYEEKSIMKKLLDKSDVSKIPSEALSTARGNLALLDNLTRFITNNIYENNKKDVKIARGY